jgi:hypothetical protein
MNRLIFNAFITSVTGSALLSLSGINSAQAVNLLQNGSFENTAGTGSSLLFMLNQQTRCQDNILLTQKFRKFLKP